MPMPSQQHSYSDHPNDNDNSYGNEEYDDDGGTEFRPSNNGYDYNNHHGSFEMVSTTNTTTTNGKKNGILATRKTSTAETLNDSSDDDDDDSENGMQFNYEDEDYYCDEDDDDDNLEDDRQLVHQPQSKNRRRRRQYIEEDGDENNNNSGDDYHLQSNLLSTLLPKHIYQYLYPPNVPKSIQLYRLENLAIPACYLLVGILQGLSGPFTNVYPLDLNASEAQQVSWKCVRENRMPQEEWRCIIWCSYYICFYPIFTLTILQYNMYTILPKTNHNI